MKITIGCKPKIIQEQALPAALVYSGHSAGIGTGESAESLDFSQRTKKVQCSGQYPKAASETSNRAAMFGDFCYADNPSTFQGRGITPQPDSYGDPKKYGEQVNIAGSNITVLKGLGPILQQAYAEACNEAKKANPSFRCPTIGAAGGGWVPRKIGGSDEISNHSWGTAVDFDPELNPFKKGNVSAIEQSPIFIAIMAKYGWSWGGDFKNIQPGLEHLSNYGDDMHFEYYGDKAKAEYANFTSKYKPATQTAGATQVKKVAESKKLTIKFGEVLEEGKKKKKGKEDRCVRIAKSKYDAWPSAYASGAVVKCRQGKIWKNIKEEEELDEEWSEKYKKSIDCKNPKGFSQRAHCQGRKKRD